MRVHTTSDVHVDYPDNAAWVDELSQADYVDDVLILAGDVSHRSQLFYGTLDALQHRFKEVCYVPGNHDLWVGRNTNIDSMDKFWQQREKLKQRSVIIEPHLCGSTFLEPLLGWYDFSFGTPSTRLRQLWADFRRCRWPQDWQPSDVHEFFLLQNEDLERPTDATSHITYSHFMPRADLFPTAALARIKWLLPVLGAWSIDDRIRRRRPDIHVYGHSHFNVDTTLEDIRYVNNAHGYPDEPGRRRHAIFCIQDG